MKTINLLAVALFISIAASAQNTPSTADVLLTLQPQAKLIGIAPLGKVYAMPTDNMPCLVPYTPAEASMPVLNMQLYQNAMPNALPLQQLPALPRINKRNLKLNLQPNADSKNLMFELLGKKKK